MYYTVSLLDSFKDQEFDLDKKFSTFEEALSFLLRQGSILLSQGYLIYRIYRKEKYNGLLYCFCSDYIKSLLNAYEVSE